MALRAPSSSIQGFRGPYQCFKSRNCSFSVKSNVVFHKARLNINCAMNMAAGQSDDHEKINLEHLMAKARKLWESAPQPVRNFPWNRALLSFIELILDLTFRVVKYLSVPLLFISSLSEMSYCAHHKKLFLVPFPLLIGIAIAIALKETALEISPLLKDAEVPWHLIVIAAFFTLIKLPGPYYPYWGRIFIPHLANGVLWSTVLSALLWSRNSRKPSATGTTSNLNPETGSQPETNQI